MATSDAHSDETLLARVRDGQADAFRALYARHASLVFAIAARSLGPRADEIVQEIWLTVWQKADTFDPARGEFRPWLTTIARRRIINELRNQRRRPRADAPVSDELADDAVLPDEGAWRRQREAALADAMSALPVSERRALSLAFLDELSHDEVARFLNVPIGTAKSRIRAALRRLRPALIVAGVVIAVLIFVRELSRERARAALEERALKVVTASDMETIHLVAGPGVPTEQHGNYRARRGTGLAVLTCSNLPAQGQYRAFAMVSGAWVPLGEPVPDANGKALVLTEDPRLSERPTRIVVTRSDSPDGPLVLESSP